MFTFKEMKKELFELFESAYKAPEFIIERFKALVEAQPESFFGKSSPYGHITGSALVLNETGDEVLLTHHGKLHKWLQLGGHWDDLSENIRQAALREVREEGYGNKDIPVELLNDGKILDLDIHSVGDHYHYDVCFLVQVDKSVPIVISNESKDLAWIKIKDIIDNKENFDPRLVRMIEKSQELRISLENTNSTLKRKM